MNKLLIVDDDLQTRQFLSVIFGHEYQVFEAVDGIQALQMVLEHRPDIVLLDGVLPRLDGLSVLSAIKSDPELSNILVVMLTGRGQLSDFERGIQLGADAYFVKPYNHKKLLLWIKENLKIHQILINSFPSHPASVQKGTSNLIH